MKKLSLAAVATASLLVAPTSLAASVSNTGETTFGYPLISAGSSRAISFQVASDQDYVLTDIQISLSPTSIQPGVWIFSDLPSKPNTILETLVSQGNGSFTSTGLNLTAGGTYWVVTRATKSGNLQYAVTESDSETGSAGWSISDTMWNGNFNLTTWNTTNTRVLQIAVNAVPATAPVPEPGTLALMALGGLALLRRRA